MTLSHVTEYKGKLTNFCYRTCGVSHEQARRTTFHAPLFPIATETRRRHKLLTELEAHRQNNKRVEVCESVGCRNSVSWLRMCVLQWLLAVCICVASRGHIYSICCVPSMSRSHYAGRAVLCSFSVSRFSCRDGLQCSCSFMIMTCCVTSVFVAG